jgi:tetratricopeptide (TPR) repeat protein
VHRLLLVIALVACAKKSVVTGPSNVVKLEIERAEKAEAARDHDTARAHYERAIASAADPHSVGFARREFAETLATWGELDSARGQLEKAVAATPDDPIAWQMLGILRANAAINDIPGAFTALEKAKQLAPRAWIPRRDLAALHFKLGAGRDADRDPKLAAEHRAAALAEYKAMLELDLPTRLRDKVKWAIEYLTNTAAQEAGSAGTAPASQAPAKPPTP